MHRRHSAPDQGVVDDGRMWSSTPHFVIRQAALPSGVIKMFQKIASWGVDCHTFVLKEGFIILLEIQVAYTVRRKQPNLKKPENKQTNKLNMFSFCLKG